MTTLHALQRTNERTGFNLKTSERFIANALERGKRAEDFRDREKDYLLRTVKNNSKALVYNTYCFIFSKENICITMFPVPKWFGKKRRYNSKNKHIREYQKNYNNYEMEDDYYGFCKVS